MNKLTIIDCLLRAAGGDENCKEVFTDWYLKGIFEVSRDKTVNMNGIIEQIEKCFSKGNHTDQEKDLAIATAEKLYDEYEKTQLIRNKLS